MEQGKERAPTTDVIKRRILCIVIAWSEDADLTSYDCKIKILILQTMNYLYCCIFTKCNYI